MNLAEAGEFERAPVGNLKRGVLVFSVIWFGQVVSIFGSGLTGFALGIWAYRGTHSVTAFALITLSSVLPGIALSPLAGAFVDRWDRRWALAVNDAGVGLCTLTIAGILALGVRALWPVYTLLAVSSIFEALQWPAYSAAVTALIPKQHLERASGIVQFGTATSQLLAPLVAGLLVGRVKIQTVLLLDFATCVVAIATVLAIRTPLNSGRDACQDGTSSLLAEARSGWTYIHARPGLLGLLLFLAAINLGAGFAQALVAPLVLSFASEAKLGAVLSIACAGLLAGSLAISVFGGPRQRIRGVLGFGLLYGLFYFALGLRQETWIIAVAYCGLLFTVPLISGCSQAIWQTKVPLGLQGRVFAVRRMIAQSSQPFALLIAGPLADHVFEPLLSKGGPLTESVGRLIGTGPGHGIGLLLIVLSLCIIASASAGQLSPRLRRLELEVPDAIRN